MTNLTLIPTLYINSERLHQDFTELAHIGRASTGGLNRLALSNEDLQARAWLADRFDQAGLMVRDDEAGNLSGTLPSANPDAKTLLIGSHLDSVPNGGFYDSSIGILSALECLRVIKENHLDLPVHLEAINFTDNEGCWYSLFGSRAIANRLDGYLNYNGLQQDVAAFRAALFRAGLALTEIPKARRDPATLAGYLEIHIEQGKRLHVMGKEIGIVTSIVGRSTYKLDFWGQAAHSGTTAPEDRRDAFHTAAVFVTRAFEFIRANYPESVLNFGNIQIHPGAFNIIPNQATLTMECRHASAETLQRIEGHLLELAEQITAEFQLELTYKRTVHMPAARMSSRFVKSTAETCSQLHIDPVYLVSYAGHDAQMMSLITPAGLIFIPSVNGISHSPHEYTEWRHIEIGANVLLNTLLKLAFHPPD